MGERKRIGLVFSYNENWIAGAYYILNIIHALNTLKDNKKPEIIIITPTKENFNRVVNETAYPYLSYLIYPFKNIEYSFYEKFVNKLSRLTLKRQLFIKTRDIPNFDFVYPRQLYLISKDLKKVNWVPDFQEDHLPHFFSKEEVLRRKTYQVNTIIQGDVVVLSSEDAKQDFVRLYPNAKAIPFVLPFAVTHPNFASENIDDLKEKYQIEKNYFFAPNQFWAHKNHSVILRAVKILKTKGVEVIVAMSGKENDYRNKENFEGLKKYIKKHQLEDNIKFLGFLPRTEQLCLFKNAIAVIQPSLFEGWSTVVEDAKKLDKFLLLSNLNVHKEQVKTNAVFFHPEDANELADKIEAVSIKSPIVIPNEYDDKIKNFGENFMNLVELSTR